MIAAVLGTRIVLDQPDSSLTQHQGVQHDRSENQDNARAPRKSGCLSEKRPKALSQQGIFDLLCAMVKGEIDREKSESGWSTKTAKLREDREASIRIMMGAMNFQQAKELYNRFYNQEPVKDQRFNIPSLGMFLAYRAAEKMATLDPRQTVKLLLDEDARRMGRGYDAALYEAVVLGWSGSDPGTAVRWWMTVAQGNSDRSNLFYDNKVDHEIYRRFAKVDFEAAKMLASEAKNTLYRSQLFAAVISGIPEGINLAEFAEGELIEMMGQCNLGPEEKRNSWASLLGLEPANKIRQAMALRWLKKDANAALSWYESEEHKKVTLDDLSDWGGFLGKWADQDQSGFMAWAKSQGGETRALGYYFGNTQASEALGYLSKMEEGAKRVEMAKASIVQGNHDKFTVIIGWLADVDHSSEELNYYQAVMDRIPSSQLQHSEKQELLEWLNAKKQEAIHPQEMPSGSRR